MPVLNKNFKQPFFYADIVVPCKICLLSLSFFNLRRLPHHRPKRRLRLIAVPELDPSQTPYPRRSNSRVQQHSAAYLQETAAQQEYAHNQTMGTAVWMMPIDMMAHLRVPWIGFTQIPLSELLSALRKCLHPSEFIIRHRLE